MPPRFATGRKKFRIPIEKRGERGLETRTWNANGSEERKREKKGREIKLFQFRSFSMNLVLVLDSPRSSRPDYPFRNNFKKREKAAVGVDE